MKFEECIITKYGKSCYSYLNKSNLNLFFRNFYKNCNKYLFLRFCEVIIINIGKDIVENLNENFNEKNFNLKNFNLKNINNFNLLIPNIDFN